MGARSGSSDGDGDGDGGSAGGTGHGEDEDVPEGSVHLKLDCVSPDQSEHRSENTNANTSNR